MHFSIFQGLFLDLSLWERRNALALYFAIDNDMRINDRRGHPWPTYDLVVPIATLTCKNQRWGENLGLVQDPQAMLVSCGTGPRLSSRGA